jgi:hypothetical protein
MEYLTRYLTHRLNVNIVEYVIKPMIMVSKDTVRTNYQLMMQEFEMTLEMLPDREVVPDNYEALRISCWHAWVFSQQCKVCKRWQHDAYNPTPTYRKMRQYLQQYVDSQQECGKCWFKPRQAAAAKRLKEWAEKFGFELDDETDDDI